MLLSAFEPGRELAVANFLLAIFCMFTFALPLLLITRGDKTEANREFLLATFNPWYGTLKEAESAQVVITDITASVKMESNLEFLSEHDPIVGLGDNISLEIKAKDLQDKSLLQADDGRFAA